MTTVNKTSYETFNFSHCNFSTFVKNNIRAIQYINKNMFTVLIKIFS